MLRRVGEAEKGALRQRPLLILALVVMCHSSPASAATPVIDAPGLWTLDRLGYDEVTLGVDERTATGQHDLVYRLPPGAIQGGSTWYLIRYHFRVSVSPNALPGTFAVSADTNGRTCASIIFQFRRTPQGPSLTSDSLGLVEGHELRTSHGLTQEIDFRNYLQFRGVRPGRNVLTFRITANALPLVGSVRVFADTGIEISSLAPARVEADIEAPARAVTVGERFTVRFQLRLAEGRPVARAFLRVSYPQDRLELHGQSDRSLAWGLRAPLTEPLDFTALKPGAASIAIQAEAAGQRADAAARVVAIDTDGHGAARWLIATVAAFSVAAAAMASLAWMRRRRR